jgi:hypothetical protein
LALFVVERSMTAVADDGEARCKGCGSVAPVSYGGLQGVSIRNEMENRVISRLEAEVKYSRRALVAMPFAIAFAAWIGRGRDQWVIATTDGRVLPVKPLDLPVMSDGDVIDWAARAVRDTLTLGHHDIEVRLNAAHLNYFTDDGFRSFVDGLDRRNVRAGIKGRQQLWQASVGAPTMTDVRRVAKGVLWYGVDVPVNIRVLSGQFQEVVNWVVQLTIVRVGEVERAKGVAIQQWSTKA